VAGRKLTTHAVNWNILSWPWGQQDTPRREKKKKKKKNNKNNKKKIAHKSCNKGL